jgi:hypothetical protein
MVFVVPTNETVSVLPAVGAPLVVPLTKFPLGKSKLFANAAVGKARAKSANTIIRFMLNPPEKTVGPSQCQSRGVAVLCGDKG